MEKKQTAVEFFWNEISNVLPFSVDSITAIKIYEIIQQAKEMEKEQIIKARQDIYTTGNLSAEQYYNKTYKSK